MNGFMTEAQAMLVKHTKCRDPLGVAQYVLGKSGAEVVGSNLAYPDDAHAIAAEIRFSCRDSKRLKLTTYHASLAIAPPERLSDDRWHQVARDYLAKMHYGLSPYLVVRHTDTEHDHIHIVAGRFDLSTGKRVPDSWDHYNAIEAIRDIEAEYGFELTPKAGSAERQSPTVSMIRHERDTGQPAVKPELQNLIDDLTGQVNHLDQFADHLEQAGVELHVKPINETILGLTYHFKGLYFSASQLGRAYTLNGLRTFRGIESPQDRQSVMAWWERRQAQPSASIKPGPTQGEEQGQPERHAESQAQGQPDLEPDPKAQPQNQELAGVDLAPKPLEAQQRQTQENEDRKRKAQRQRRRQKQRNRQMEL